MSEQISLHLSTILRSLPESPGVYQYFDDEKTLLYVGKAKNLKKRVSSYFSKEHDNARLKLLVKKISDIKTVKVDTELDALLLENNLIKSLKPKYNVNLRDDKTYPWIVIKNERFARIFPTRKMIKDGSEYFGPYASGKLMHTLLDLIRQIYPLRTCTYDLSETNISKLKFRECLEFHIGRCKAPCTGKQSLEEYEENLNGIRQILKGELAFAIKETKQKMQRASEQLEFENAEIFRSRIEILSAHQGKSTVVHPSITQTEVFSILSDEKFAYVHYFNIKDGSIVQSQTLELNKKMSETDEELLLFAILEFRNRFKSVSKEIIVPFEPAISLPDCNYLVPKIGDKKKLLDLCQRNAISYKHEKEKQIMFTDPEKHVDRIMEQMKKDLRMHEQPRRIEGFDNSNIQGEFAVSAMPVFIDGKPAKKEYRHFNIKTVKGPDDFATMEEVLTRRYSRVLEDKLPLPQLIIIDGGKGQLSAAVGVLKKLKLYGKVAIIGIAKRLEEIYFPGDPLPLYLDKRSETLKVIQHIRDEAHRFGITHHRNKRSRETFKTELNDIEGISDVTSDKLLRELKSVKNIREATFEELENVIGKSKAKLIFDHFHKNTE